MGKIKDCNIKKEDFFDNSHDELCFLIWKAKLNKELNSFWKNMNR